MIYLTPLSQQHRLSSIKW